MTIEKELRELSIKLQNYPELFFLKEYIDFLLFRFEEERKEDKFFFSEELITKAHCMIYLVEKFFIKRKINYVGMHLEDLIEECKNKGGVKVFNLPDNKTIAVSIHGVWVGNDNNNPFLELLDDSIAKIFKGGEK